MTVKELNEKKDRCVYIVLVDDYMVGSSWKSDLEKYLISDDSLVTADDGLEQAQLIHGFVLDPNELPYELPPELMETRSIYLLMASTDGGESVGVEEHDNIESLTASIERWMQEDEDASIDNFAVIVAEEMEFGISIRGTGSNILEKEVYGD
jgi:hypothetical protein